MLEHIPPPDGRTLRQQVETALRLSRELDEHLRQTLTADAARLRRLTDPEPPGSERAAARPGQIKPAGEPAGGEDPDQRDRAVRHGVDALLKSDRLAAALRDRLGEYCGIDRRGRPSRAEGRRQMTPGRRVLPLWRPRARG